MKKFLLFAMLCMMFNQPSLQAQEENGKRFTIKTNPMSALGGPLFVAFIPITGEYKILFEAKTAKKQSIEVGTGFLGPSLLLNLDEITSNDSVSGVSTRGFRVQVAYKFFLTSDAAPEGFFVGPHFSYAKARLENKDNPEDNFEASKINLNVLFGYQLITSGGFTLNIYTGLGLKIRDYNFADESSDVWDFDTGNHISPGVPFGFTFGFAF